MKKFVYIFIAILETSLRVDAQLNDRFLASGNPQLAGSVGAYTTNVHVGWRQVQQYPASSYNWSSVDTRIQANQVFGLRTIITLRCTSPVSADDSIPGTCAYEYSHGNTSVDSKSSWIPRDTTRWKNFLAAFIERYDGDGIQDMPGLIYPVTQWHIGQEWQRIWCSVYADTSLEVVQEFVRYVNLTYDEIKRHQPNSEISFAGIDTRHDLIAFYDGYATSKSSMCINQNCSTPLQVTPAQLSLTPIFLAQRRNVLYLIRNAHSDKVDIHQYGRWQEIPQVVQWLKDQAMLGNRSVIFLEGGGPFCKACEQTYHSGSDSVGYLPPQLVRDNVSYIVYYFITGLANGIKRLHWHITPEYTNWGNIWGDLDLLSINNEPKPSFYTYRYLAENIFSRTDADTVKQIQTNDSSLYYYRIEPMGMSVLWSMKQRDTLNLSARGTLFVSHIPTIMGDSLIREDTLRVNGSTKIPLTDRVPIFISGSNFILNSEESLTAQQPTGFVLMQNYPNPFSVSTTIRFQITDYGLETAEVRNPNAVITLKVYDLLGREVLDLSSKIINHDYLKIDNSELPAPGMYFYQLRSEKNIQTRKMIYLPH